MIRHTIFIDDSNFDFIDRNSEEVYIPNDIIANFDKPYRLQIGDHFNNLYSLMMYEDKSLERCIEKLEKMLKKYKKKYDGLDVSGFLIDDPDEETLFVMVKVNFV